MYVEYIGAAERTIVADTELFNFLLEHGAISLGTDRGGRRYAFLSGWIVRESKLSPVRG